jgi:ABC-type multidrug transport system fused ATPase/permease subunit
MRIYDPKSGKICVDGYDLKDLNLKFYHEQITIVNQNPALFNTTIRENIAYGAKKNVSEEEILEAAKLANCYEFIMEFRAGFDTYVGDKGA